MSDLMLTYRIQATSNYCNVTTYVDATDEDQAETLGLQQIADEYNVPIIEDAAEALGSRFKNQS